uniref:C6 domain-containing protein n=1 Tax=Caenorhabditis japonica TaxID=281687 RepID=A0A8R1HPA9_CAEJA
MGLLFLFFVPFLFLTTHGQLAAYSDWKPTVIRYCETLKSTSSALPFMAGITCGSSSYNAMSAYYDVAINSDVSLGLLNVGWITTAALTTEAGFWKACKSQMVRIFDGLYTDPTLACTQTVNPPPGLPKCNETDGNLLYRSGSGYCMKSNVCGATVPISFLTGPGDSTLIYSWLPTDIATLTGSGYRIVATCYGYKKLANTGKTSANMEAGDVFY